MGKRCGAAVCLAVAMALAGCGSNGWPSGSNAKPTIRSFVVNGRRYQVNSNADPVRVTGLPAGQKATVQCMADDQQGEDLKYTWSADTSITPDSADGQTATVSTSEPKEIQVGVVVRDPRDGVASASIILVFGDPELRVTLEPSATTVLPGVTITLIATITSPSSTATNTLTFGGQGGTWATNPQKPHMAQWTAPWDAQPGAVYTLSVVVKDSQGRSAGATSDIVVQQPPASRRR